MRNRQFVFTPKIEYQLVAKRCEANLSNLQFPFWCSILELVRTHFAAAGGEEIPPRKAGGAAPLKTAKEPGEKHRLEPCFNFGGRKFFSHERISYNK